ncbi:type I restriction endonuclease subunit R [Chryseobacterium salipaludis]|uniref:type I restriction endonuclease subunit R n=1 Tax=Chryseobacterium TaxID=59732 RepID=UPI001FF3ACB0|nr:MULTISPECIES: type I restriction endonuclease subunit R [Chryseobacterium]MCJ8498765.1 type I restriction endonuclease subunit R [Chryseobacterium salipaludis]MCX3297333.1 type I restriction endonuclease subunit R [Planobacterium sp. JC490]
MAAVISEDHIEQIIIQEFIDLGYHYLNGVDISPEGLYKEREYNEVVLKNRLQEAIAKHNPTIPAEAQEEALRKVLRSDSPELFQNNYRFHKYLTDGVEVEFRKGDRIAGDKVWLVDYDNPHNNEFLVINQFTVIEGNVNKRPDVILFVNGLPLVVIELKNAADENADVKAAFNQLQTYKQTIPSLFQYNALLVASDGWDALYGSLTSPKQFFVPWKSIDGELMADENIPQMEVMAKGMLNKEVFLDLIRHFTIFHQNKEQLTKIVPRYHQYFAANKAVEATKKATAVNGDQRAGVIWHTQGSGKSLSMAFYAGKLVLQLQNPTLVILTDRNDLDDQLFDTFSLSQDLLRQTPVQAENRDHLKDLLSVGSGGIVFTTIQKFLPEIEQKIDLGNGKFKNIKGQFDELSDRRNIVVIADEAHRSQYDFIDGFAKHMRDALPNASFIGFTGTPIENTDKNTQAVFGDYIDVYDIQQAVEDGATVRIFYENRLAKIALKEENKYQIDEQLNLVAEEMADYGETEEGISYDIESKKAKWARLEAIVGHPDRLKLIATDIVKHFEERNAILDGKGMIVCMSRRIAVELYDEIIKIRPDWHSDDDNEGAIKVVMTGSSSDPLPFQPHVRNKAKRKALGERLKDPKDVLKLAIVRDMWLTGFDAPSLHTLYIDKPMKGHNLMQAIARVNRVYKDKEGGLVVDYIGIATDLKKALSVYTESGGKGKPAFDQEEASAVMMSKYEIVAQMFSEQPKDHTESKGFNYLSFFNMTPKEKLYFPIQAANYILGLEDGKARYVNAVTALSKAFAISVPHPSTIEIRDQVGLFQAIKSRIVKVTQSSKKGKSDEEIETAIKQILSDAVVADEVIDIFDAAGIKKPDISILSDEFLAEVRGMKHKNLAFELLKKLLNDEVKTRQRTNIVQSKKFSEMIENAVRNYQNNLITSAEVIQELINLAKDLKEADRKGENLGLDFREFAFYSALEVNDSAVAILGDDILRHIARELVDTVRSNSSIDWTVRENVQAKMRIAVKKILRKHGYPPDLELKATETVLEQAKLMANEVV